MKFTAITGLSTIHEDDDIAWEFHAHRLFYEDYPLLLADLASKSSKFRLRMDEMTRRQARRSDRFGRIRRESGAE